MRIEPVVNNTVLYTLTFAKGVDSLLSILITHQIIIMMKKEGRRNLLEGMGIFRT